MRSSSEFPWPTCARARSPGGARRSGPREPVDRVVHAQLVPGHRLRGDDHRVARLDRDVLVVAVGDARERRHRLALAAGAEDHRPLRPSSARSAGLDEDLLRDVEVAEAARDVHVLAQRAADRARPGGRSRCATSIACCTRWMFDANDAISTRPLQRRNDRAERLAHRTLGRRDAGPLGVRRVAEHEVDALVPSSASRPTSVRKPSTGVWSIL